MIPESVFNVDVRYCTVRHVRYVQHVRWYDPLLGGYESSLCRVKHISSRVSLPFETMSLVSYPFLRPELR